MGKRVLRWVSGLLAGAALIGLGMYFREVGLEDADQTASVIGAFVGLGGLALAAYSIVLARRGNSPPVQLQDLADALAHAVRGQWEAEVQVRRLNDPYPLPVAWTNADPRLMEPWPLLEELARSWPGGPPGATADWAATPQGCPVRAEKSTKSSAVGCLPGAYWSWGNPESARPCCSFACC